MIAFTIIFINERATVNNIVIPGVASATNPFGGYTISEIKTGINDGTITTIDSNGDGKTLINAYIALYANAQYKFIDFSLMTFVNSAFAQPKTDPATA
jgi:hypothetical protein